MKQLKKLIEELGVNRSPGSSVRKGFTYNPIPFPGCEGIPCHRRDASVKRWEAIDADVGQWFHKRVLDYGCATGYFSFQAMKKGAIVTGVEADKAARDVCKHVFDLYEIDYGLLGKFEATFQGYVYNYDIVFALNILNWLGRKEAELFLKWAAHFVKKLYVEMPVKNDGMGGAEWLKNDKDIVKWLTKNTEYESIKPLITTMGPGGKERTVYVCS